MSDYQVTDLSYLREMTMDDDSIIKDTTEAFLENMPGLVQQMKQYYADEEWQKLGKVAHQIKPNMTYMGMDKGRSIVLNIEKQVKENNISEDLDTQLTEFEKLCNQACTELASKLEELN
ncbi:Hpt domain-containing protein [Fodinibius halophilus]|uniref:Hpt domain-containing protein n=1 Tax=Fodinibius halophilus TaxID=1736908 RepID=A0A6M1SZR9_9BACT|nr:Hpt domain-containing protein [Fodinibius halophilus]NGP89358.1 Hpt domain-containing protein [Fodinibius halophilus]